MPLRIAAIKIVADMARSRATVGLLLVACAVACAPHAALPGPPLVRPMPAGADWAGVYASPTHGDINLLVTDQRADGGYRTPDGILGKLCGAIDGDQIRFVWREQRKNDYGHRIPWFGRGYLVYSAGAAGRPDELHGQWGLEYSEVGTALMAVKRQGQPPDIWSLRPGSVEETDDDSQYDEFDDDGFDEDQ